MAGHGFGRADGNRCAKYLCNRGAFHAVIKWRRGAVHVDIADIIRCQTGMCQCRFHRGNCPDPVGVRGIWMMGIGCFANPHQGNVACVPAQREQRATFADINAVTVFAERITDALGDGIKRVKSAHGQTAQTIDPANNHGVTHARIHQSLGGCEGLAA